MKKVWRAVKNEWNEYNDGEILVRNLTKNDNHPPNPECLQRLNELTKDNYASPSIYRMLNRRMHDLSYLMHVEKSLIVAEYLLKHSDSRFVRFMKMQTDYIKRLCSLKYEVKINELEKVDKAQIVRRRANRIFTLLTNDKELENQRDSAQGGKQHTPKLKSKASLSKKNAISNKDSKKQRKIKDDRNDDNNDDSLATTPTSNHERENENEHEHEHEHKPKYDRESIQVQEQEQEQDHEQEQEQEQEEREQEKKNQKRRRRHSEQQLSFNKNKQNKSHPAGDIFVDFIDIDDRSSIEIRGRDKQGHLIPGDWLKEYANMPNNGIGQDGEAIFSFENNDDFGLDANPFRNEKKDNNKQNNNDNNVNANVNNNNNNNNNNKADPEDWLTQLTKLDNLLDSPKQNKSKSNGKTLTQMAQESGNSNYNNEFNASSMQTQHIYNPYNNSFVAANYMQQPQPYSQSLIVATIKKPYVEPCFDPLSDNYYSAKKNPTYSSYNKY